MTNYTHTSLSQLRALLAARLGDTSMVQWLSAELDLYIGDTLGKWGLLTGYWRDRATFPTAASTAFYDLPAQATLATQLAYTRTDRAEIGIMQYMLREPYDPIDGTGMSDQFTFSAMVTALERARNTYLADTLSVLTESTIIAAADESQLALPDTLINLRRLVWLSQDGAYSNLHLSDETEAVSYNTLYASDLDTPSYYSRVASSPLDVRLIPRPIATGSVKLIAAHTGAALDPATPVVLGVPNDITWAIRSLALADLLGRDGPAYDPSRAAFCISEYQLGVQLAVSSSVLLAAEINGVATLPCGVAELDYGYAAPHWQSSTGAPTDLAVIGDLVALRPVPDGVYSITVDVIAKATRPSLDGEQIQVGREDLDAILDGCEALALFKLGGAATDDSTRLMRQMFTAAQRYNARLSALGYAASMSRIAELDSDSRSPAGQGRGVGSLPAGGNGGAE